MSTMPTAGWVSGALPRPRGRSAGPSTLRLIGRRRIAISAGCSPNSAVARRRWPASNKRSRWIRTIRRRISRSAQPFICGRTCWEAKRRSVGPGRSAQALRCFRRVLDLDPDWPEGYRSLAAAGQQADEPQLRRLAAVLKNRGRSVSDRISAGFALGMLLDNGERCDEAFPCFAEANALHRQPGAAAG